MIKMTKKQENCEHEFIATSDSIEDCGVNGTEIYYKGHCELCKVKMREVGYIHEWEQEVIN